MKSKSDIGKTLPDAGPRQVFRPIARVMTSDALAARYRKYAAQCVAVAQKMETEAEKLLLLDMAQAWFALALQAEAPDQQRAPRRSVARRQ